MINDLTILLGFDFGLKRIGIASGQCLTKTASPITVIPAKQGEPQWNQIDDLIKTWNPGALIVGIPYHMDDTEQWITHKARMFAQKLSVRTQLPTYEIDERLTTKSVKEYLFEHGGFHRIKKAPIDSLAAVVILENWMRNFKKEAP